MDWQQLFTQLKPYLGGILLGLKPVVKKILDDNFDALYDGAVGELVKALSKGA
jgi:hypothetical protein